MLLLPTHQEQHYEPLVKQGATTTTTTMVAKLKQRKVVMIIMIAALLASLHLLRTSIARHYYDPAPVQTESVAPWILDEAESSGPSQEAPAVVSPSAVVAAIEDDTVQVESSGVFSESKQEESAAAAATTSCSVHPSTTHSTPASDEKATYGIADDEWKIPADVHFDSSSPLWRTRFRPFFRQEKSNIHQEKGFGTKVDLNDAPFVRRSVYRHLLDSLNSFSHAHDFHFWLAHGSLLGQKWGKKIMSGDTDVDLQCTLAALHRVQKYEKQLWQDRFELLVNPHYLIRKTLNTNGLGRDKNVIDARWIDTLTGFYIDITALSSSSSDDDTTALSSPTTIVSDKSPHTYPVDAISPNRKCRFEDMDLWCPNQIETVLDEEYKEHDLPHFQTWRFNYTIQTFTEVDCPDLVQMYTHPTRENCDEECRFVVSHRRTILYKALVMTGDVRREGCLLDITFPGGLDGNNVKRTYWARKVEGQVIDHRTMKNTEFPAVIV